jgi:hypothetical protein
LSNSSPPFTYSRTIYILVLLAETCKRRGKVNCIIAQMDYLALHSHTTLDFGISGTLLVLVALFLGVQIYRL